MSDIRHEFGPARCVKEIQGTGADLPSIRAWSLEFGSFFTPQDVARAEKVAVLGAVARDELFGAGSDPTGDTLSASGTSRFVSSASSARKGQAALGPDQDDTVVIPYTSMKV